MEKITRKIGGRTFAIGATQWDNWYGYIGGKRVTSFFGRSHEQEERAKAWLDEQERLYARVAPTAATPAVVDEHPTDALRWCGSNTRAEERARQAEYDAAQTAKIEWLTKTLRALEETASAARELDPAGDVLGDRLVEMRKALALATELHAALNRDDVFAEVYS